MGEDNDQARLAEVVKFAIGYAPVRLSIRDHPEITWEHRTIQDRDELIARIVPAVIAALPSLGLVKADDATCVCGRPLSDHCKYDLPAPDTARVGA